MYWVCRNLTKIRVVHLLRHRLRLRLVPVVIKLRWLWFLLLLCVGIGEVLLLLLMRIGLLPLIALLLLVLALAWFLFQVDKVCGSPLLGWIIERKKVEIGRYLVSLRLRGRLPLSEPARTLKGIRLDLSWVLLDLLWMGGLLVPLEATRAHGEQGLRCRLGSFCKLYL